MMTLKMISSPSQPGRDIAVVGGTVEKLTGPAAMLQRMENALRLYKGEWFLAPETGIEWFPFLQRRPANTRLLRREIERTIAEDPEVQSILSVNLSEDRKIREFSISFRVLTDYGVISGEV